MLNELKTLVHLIVKEAIAIPETYRQKEKVRGDLQAFVQERVRSGEVKNQEELDELFKTVNLAMTSLKMIPYDVFVKLNNK